jgi:hypothetical protein
MEKRGIELDKNNTEHWPFNKLVQFYTIDENSTENVEEKEKEQEKEKELLSLLQFKYNVSPSSPGGGRKKSAKLPKKDILGKLRCIYKVPGSKKEHVKYKGSLITVTDYKNLMKAKAKSKTKPKQAKPKQAKAKSKPNKSRKRAAWYVRARGSEL